MTAFAARTTNEDSGLSPSPPASSFATGISSACATEEGLKGRVTDAALDLAQQAGADPGAGGERIKAVPLASGQPDEPSETLDLVPDNIVGQLRISGIPSFLPGDWSSGHPDRGV